MKIVVVTAVGHVSIHDIEEVLYKNNGELDFGEESEGEEIVAVLPYTG